MTTDRKSSAVLPQDMAGAVNLLAHPVAGAAAISALGIGLASHAFGAWMGVLAAATEASQRMFDAVSDGKTAGEAAPKAPAGKVRATARAVMQQANAYARDIAQAKDAGEAASAVEQIRSGVSVQPASASIVPQQPASVARPAHPDDLKAIAGIGPKLETVLNGLGIWTYDQVAAWSAGNVAWVEEYFGFNGRIVRDGWINQATALGRQAKSAGSN